MTIKQQGGIFGRNPTFNDVDVEGTLTVDGNAVPDAGTILVDSDIGVTVQGYDADTAKRDTAQTFTAKQDFIFAGGGNYVAQFQNTTAATPYAVSIKDAASSSNGYPLLIISNSAGSDTYFRVDSGTSDITAGKNIRFLSSGLGIDFSATSGTGTSELFDDYEEGTWTPTVGNQTVVGSFSSNGAYTKIGRQVFFRGQVIGSTSITGSSGTYIGGLPFISTASGTGSGTIANQSSGAIIFIGPADYNIYIIGGYSTTGNFEFSGMYFA
jgi:hypothetical protein